MSGVLVTVLLPVYNGANDVVQAVDSILKQSFTDFELLIINDGSKDNSAEVLDAIKDPRIRLIHQENMGLAATLNRGMQLARGTYIARQDQDDLSHPQRLQMQLEYMEAHPECILLGSAAEIWVQDQPSDRVHQHPVDHATLSFDLLFNNPFVHSSVMMNRERVLQAGGYSTDRERQPPEDYELWSRLARIGRVANLAEILLVYREVPQSMSRSGPNPFLDKLVTISAENLALANGMTVPNQDCIDAAAFTHSALHRLSHRPSLRRMQALINGAAQAIALKFDTPDVVARGRGRSDILKYQYMLHFTDTQWLKPWLSRIRAIIRKIVKR
ncbi:glycosyltransferase family 2 protein [Herbaspirillum rubrisubalbicans]|uniref:Glycosyltransferase family 2 protein n=1 Tax=Herbaspirillum rubrisubalbicans TaxID=80842 RepID=A0AAD0XE74_9BURK|nr:glycosyltransferase family 2 protein [Herbaspirillum rubrisubalbicans]AYR22731.1 glycosyltransferase family 2 protein [Herbaspirillum rubrisubalbicans]